MTSELATRWFELLAAVLAASTVCTVARADLPSPPDYVETCTVARMARPGTECRACRAWQSSRDECVKTLGAEGFTKECQAAGASAWDEVWCRPGSQGPPASGSSDPSPTLAELLASRAKSPPTAETAGSSPASSAVPAGSADGDRDASSAVSEPPALAPAPVPSHAGPSPGARGCGGCAVGRSESSALLAGLGLTLVSASAGCRLRARRRRR